MSDARAVEFNSDMKAAKKIKGDVLVWWPRVKLDDDGDLTMDVEGGNWVITRWEGGAWDEPDYFEACGDWFGDDYCYATEPTHWLPCPAPIKNKIAEAALRASAALKMETAST